MPEKTVGEKLLIKPGMKVLLVNPPQEYETILGSLPQGVQRVGAESAPVDFIQVFVHSRQELEAQLPQLKDLLKPAGLLWITYLKGTSKTKTDINRDSINAYAHTLGLEGIAMISVDEDWSALRVKRVG